MRPVRIGTRGSSLAMCQAEIVQARLAEKFPERSFNIHAIKAQADKNPEAPLAAMSGEGIFVKELEHALEDERIDLAVHSLKDLPLDIPQSLRIAAVLKRDDPRDALVSREARLFGELPAGSRVGTSSARRRSQLLHWRNDVDVTDIRGNVDTRLRKLDEGKYDAVVIAACGLIRLGLEERISEYLEFARVLPEPGQGALAIEARDQDSEVLDLLSPLEDPISRACIEAERAFLRSLGGGCRVPIGAYAAFRNGTLQLEGIVASPDGSSQIRGALSAPMTEPVTLGEGLASRLASQGAADLLSKS